MFGITSIRASTSAFTFWFSVFFGLRSIFAGAVISATGSGAGGSGGFGSGGAGANDGGYDATVAAALHASSGAPLTEAQKEAAALAEKKLLDSVEKDPQAAEAYKNLQRLRNGR